MTDSEILTLMALCSQWWGSWRRPDSAEAMLVSWRELLADVDPAAARAALAEHATSGAQFPPPVGVIRRRAFELTQTGGKAPTVDEAWAEVQRNIARVGWTASLGRPLVWSHPAIEAVVRSMGWDSLCQSQNEVADRAHFAKMYAERVERDVRDAAMAPAVRGVLEAAAGLTAIGSGE